jgi:hypothetical protein
VVEERDPFAGDALWPSEGLAPEYAAVERSILHAVQSGRRSAFVEAQAAVHAIGLDEEPFADKRPMGSAPLLPAETWFCDIAENSVPDIGVIAPDRVFGPWAELGLTRREHIRAAGVMAFSVCLSPSSRPIERWERDQRSKPKASLFALRAVFRAPAMLWRVEGGVWKPRLRIVERFRPTGPVFGLPFQDGDIPELIGDGDWIARVFLVDERGWFAALAQRACPDVPLPPLKRRLLLAWWRWRLTMPAATWEDALRFRAEVLYRFCAEYRWIVEEERRCMD